MAELRTGPAGMPSEQLGTLLEISQLLGRTLHLPEVLQTSIDSAVRVTGLDTGAIYLLTDDVLFLGATTPALPPGVPDVVRHAPLAEHPHIRQAIDDRAAYFYGDLAAVDLAPAEIEAAKARDLQSMLYVPLLADDKPLGVFLVGSSGRVVDMTVADIGLCTTLASTISLAISNARLYESLQSAHDRLSRAYQEAVENKEQLRALANNMTLSQERQRRELAVEIHDRVTQPLAVLKMRLHEAVARFSDHGTDDSFSLGIGLLDEAIAEARTITAETSPPFIFDVGLVPALDWLCERTSSHGVECELFADDSFESLAEDVRLFAFQAVRELLANVLRHSRARNVTVALTRDDGFLAVRVTDNGAGFPTADLNAGPGAEGGFGLFSLGERANHLGGSLEIASSLGAGTSIILRIPSDGDAAS